jgi:hypothetical protein
VQDGIPYVISGGALLLAIINTAYARHKDVQGEFKHLAEKVEGLLTRLTVVETKAEIFFRGMSVSSAQALHSPHTKELDSLLEKFQRDEIQNEKDLIRLKAMLQEVVNDDPNSMRQKFALDILTLIHVRFEIGGDLVENFRKQTRAANGSR